jgi:hypothetical protein
MSYMGYLQVPFPAYLTHEARFIFFICLQPTQGKPKNFALGTFKKLA